MSDHISRLTRDDRIALALTEDDLDLDRGPDGHIMRHQVTACSDGHFLPLIFTWMARWFPHNADLIAIPGSGLELCLEHKLRNAMMERAQLLHRAHNTNDVWCLFHNGCGAYAHHRNRPDPQRERAEQLMDMAHIHGIYRELGLLNNVRLHFGILLTRGPGFVPLSQLVAQAHALNRHFPALVIPPLERDLNEYLGLASVGAATPLPV